MKKIAILLCLFGAVSFSAYADYTGRVFIDKNGNGIYDQGEKAFAGIAVSDGLNVVKTASDGTFTLPGHNKGKERFIFITTPSGYIPSDKHYLPIEEGRKSYDFGVKPYGHIAKDGSHSFIQISDTEISSVDGNEEWAGNLRDYMANEKVYFVVHTGDICYEKGLQAHIKLMNKDNMNTHVYYCIGNHDLVKGKYGEEMFESLYGPVFYSFDAGNVHYIVTPMLGGDHRPSYTRKDVYEWLKNDLAQVSKDKAVMIFNHDNLKYDDNNDFFYYGADKNEYIDLKDHNLKAWLYGHWHVNYIKQHGDIYTISTATVDKGGIDHSPNTYRVMHVDKKGDFASELRYSYIDKHIKIATPGDKAAYTANGSLPLTVNAYSSVSPVREVAYSFVFTDGSVVKNRKMKQFTDWTWYADVQLPSKYAGQMVTVKAEAIFDTGEKAVAEKIFKYDIEKITPSYSSDWTNLLGNPSHIGVTDSKLSNPLELAWVRNLGANVYMTSPVIYKGNVYMASMDDDYLGKAHVYALNGKTGEVIWKYKVRNSVKNTIVVESGLLIAQDVDGNLYAFDPANGKLEWEVKLEVNPMPAQIEGLVAKDGIVYAGTGRGLSAVDAKTGNIIWKNKDWGQNEGTTSTMSVDDKILISSSQWGALYGNDVKTGEMKWRISDGGMRFRASSPAIHGNLLYVISDKSLFIVDKDTGNVIVRKEYPFSVDATSTPLLTDKFIIFGTIHEGMVAVDRTTLEVVWKYRTNDALVYTGPYTRKPAATVETSPVLSGNTIYFGASDGFVYGLDAEKGELVWKYEVGAPVLTTMSVSGSTLLFADLGGNVYAFVGEK